MKNFKELREKYRSKFPSSLVSAAVKIAIDMSGNMTGAYKKIEAMKKGLANDPMVKDALRQANEEVKDVEESSAAWAKSLETIAKKKQLDKISDKDKATLVKIAQMLAKEKK